MKRLDFRYALVLAAVGLSIATFSDLPRRVPTHFDASGHPNDFVSKPFGPFVLPLALVVLELVLRYLRARFVPDDERVKTALEPSHTAVLAALFMALGAPFWNALGLPLAFHECAFFAVGVVLLAAAWTLRHLPPNTAVGFITPRTLAGASEWRSSHNRAAWPLVIGGAVSAALSVTSAPLSVLGVVLLVACVASMACALSLVRRTSDASAQGGDR